MARQYTESELEAFLDESLAPGEMAEVEAAMREDKDLGERLSAVIGRRDAGVHSLGDIWRRHRTSCPTREQLGSFLLGALDGDLEDYIRFHIETVGCRLCGANLEDLKVRQKEGGEVTTSRRRKYFESSARAICLTNEVPAFQGLDPPPAVLFVRDEFRYSIAVEQPELRWRNGYPLIVTGMVFSSGCVTFAAGVGWANQLHPYEQSRLRRCVYGNGLPILIRLRVRPD